MLLPYAGQLWCGRCPAIGNRAERPSGLAKCWAQYAGVFCVLNGFIMVLQHSVAGLEKLVPHCDGLSRPAWTKENVAVIADEEKNYDSQW